MTPQSSFVINASIEPGARDSLEKLLVSMNRPNYPGMANPENDLVPFGKFGALHFARFFIAQDDTLKDFACAGLPVPEYPVTLRFAHENPNLMPCDVPTPIGWWIRNWLHYAIIPVLLALPWAFAIEKLIVQPLWLLIVVASFGLLAIVIFIGFSIVATWTFALLVALGLMLIPFFIIYSLWLIPLAVAVIIFAIALRRYEKTEPEIIPAQTPEHDNALAVQEDHDVSNQFTVIGSVKPSKFRRVLLIVILWFTQYGARHIYNEGFLARIQTIHFAHWIFINDKRRVLFLSNYDGSRHAYMDDFINKVSWGLNIIFGNGFGYPRTRWMIFDGAKNELRFKDTNRNHQIPTQVWYKAYPGLTAFDLARNLRIRKGLHRRFMRKAKIRAWLRDL